MRLALRLARRAFGQTSPNPMVGAVLAKNDLILGKGWHHRAGEPHAEIEALRDAQNHGHRVRGATLYVTLEPCSTHGRTPPCCEAILAAGIRTVIVAATDPNPAHAGRGFDLLRQSGVRVHHGLLADVATGLNAAFNHWIVHRTPLVTVKAAMTLDGKIATATGESKWITSSGSRKWAMRLRQAADAILVGVNTIVADDPSLTIRGGSSQNTSSFKPLRRIILDSHARIPLTSRVLNDDFKHLTTVVVGCNAPSQRAAALAKHVSVLQAPLDRDRIDLHWVMHELGAHSVTHLLVEGGGEVNGSFLDQGLAHRIAFFYAPKILGGRCALKSVGGMGADSLRSVVRLSHVRWRKVGVDLLLQADIDQHE